MNVPLEMIGTENDCIQNKQEYKNDQIERLHDAINLYNIMFYQKYLRNCSSQLKGREQTDLHFKYLIET